MSIKLRVPEVTELKPRITVFGVGGAGGNAVANMIRSELQGVEFVVANTDAQALAQSPAQRRIQLGHSVTQGLGAGSRPEIGAAAAEEALDEIREHLQNAHMIFVTAGMGGGTGTGAAPIIARAARDQGILTVGVVTKPFHFEGGRRMRVAEEGIAELQQYVDTLIIIPNQNLFRIANEKTTFAQAFAMADEVLHSGVRGITDLMVMPGLINLDFADIRTAINEMGKAMMGTGEAEGDNRAVIAAEAAISNPLLDEVSLKGAKGVLIHIMGGMDLTLFEVDEATNRIRSEVDPDALIKVGSTFSEALEGKMRVSVVATGIEADQGRVAQQPPIAARPLVEAPRRVSKPLSSGGTVVSAPPPSNPVSAQLQQLEERVQDIRPAPHHVAPPPQAPSPRATGDLLSRPQADAHREAPKPSVERPEPAVAREPVEPRRAPEIQLGGAERAASRTPAEDTTRAKRRSGGFFERMTSRFSGEPAEDAPARPEQSEAKPARVAPNLQAREERAPERGTGDRMFPASMEEEQLEIPAFLRRQIN